MASYTHTLRWLEVLQGFGSYSACIWIRWFPAPYVHSSKGAGKGFPLVTTFDSDTNTIFIVLENNYQSSTRSCSWHDATLFECDAGMRWLRVGVNRVMHSAISTTLLGAHHQHRHEQISSFVIVLSTMLASGRSGDLFTTSSAKMHVNESAGELQ